MRPMRALALLSVASIGLCSCAGQSAPSATASAVRYQAHLAAGGTPPEGGTLANPHAGDAAVAKQGALLFTTMNCDGCHGGDASGWVGPDLADGRWRYGGSDAEVFSTIYYGRPKGMPAFGGVLGTEGVWTLVTYIRSLPAPADVPTESWVGN
ncbi:MAG: c-type cytochrome [Steroidobacteraceae bacterium]